MLLGSDTRLEKRTQMPHLELVGERWRAASADDDVFVAFLIQDSLVLAGAS